MTDAARPNSYDEVPYPSGPISSTHPDRLATVATLFGMRPPAPDRCRFLELGCADAGNLLALAEWLPGSEFVGIDLSARHVEAGQRAVAELGLRNVTLRQMSILDVGPALGTFDYIACHGVYSWVPPPVQEKVLAVCRGQLAPDGVAYVSYNTYPGWHARGMVREMMRYHTRGDSDPPTCTARARDLLAFLIGSVPEGKAVYGQFLKEELERIKPCKDSYVFHEHLEEVNEPVYFHEFAQRAARHGLQYLAEADVRSMLPQRFGPEVAGTLDRLGDDVIGREQYLDFLNNRMFRQTLLCHREVSLLRQLRPEQIAAFDIASRARPVAPVPDVQSDKVEEFRGPSGVIASTGHAVSKMAFVHLAETWPASVPFDTLQATARARLAGDAVVVQDAAAYARDTLLLSQNLLQAFTAGVVDLRVHSPRLDTEPGERPRAGALARRQARDGDRVTNARQELVQLDPLSRHLLRGLDGTRDRPALVDFLAREILQLNVVVERHGRPVRDPDRLRAVLDRELDANLRRLARSALLFA
jgi:methyltransferase-like protein/2-polyprenyl-3-methyl-5-hydroxy-6-metoxy-1,4-benzoquinol methylase